MRRTASVLFLVLVVIAAGCTREGGSPAEMMQQRRTDALLAEINRQVGMPNIVNFQQKKLMKMIYELTDRADLVCYAYLQSEYTGRLVYLGRCIGFGVPFSAQYTNPMKIVDDPYGNIGSGGRVIPQADPNGLYMPTSSDATWLMLIDPKTNEPKPVYIEPKIVVSPFPLDEGVAHAGR